MKLVKMKSDDGTESYISVMEIQYTHSSGIVLGRAFSKKDSGTIAVIGIPLTFGLAVLDVDNKEVVYDTGVVGYSETPRGRHYYVQGEPTVAQLEFADRLYHNACLQMCWWRERLFNQDGSRRVTPVLTKPCLLLEQYIGVREELQEMAEANGWNVPARDENVADNT